ncbi:hypothetical protein A3J11_02015 [Candidatus Kaiserbacteria bacterium RIFCSPLOWO2_02_FULL_55_12]|uniref:Ribulose-phosphate 3-epimerase n=2 Tax=Candidatus Kaiseribacteriota TaxID=1752734 RepID=A0A1F6F1R1_9BACT|nr:MAG: Ribulose-phosphate 3-epimerase [Candidatus Peribacteria bacterium GW2011_GWC2_54_8]OGG64716.1 MAG: hypothetical protein A3C94_00175 [Candidatus Kaiserbacteria bacterium RIFCSPHIGHO2_02_FULL_55_17]OGG79802.1 MAG: hypothetical protein A3J11_02015 [Candidatus Kaiserbacteria bacterium RIFCSPLOWO2_02_FULL_55_12]
MGIVIPAVLPSSRKELEEKLALFASIPAVSRVQIDVVDGRFAAPASWPYNSPSTKSDLVLGEMLPHLDHIEYEIDLMCVDAEVAVEAWLTLGATRLTLHAESVIDLPRLIAFVRDRYGDFISLGLALSVASELALIEQCLEGIAYVQFMGIARIGRQGQPLDPRVFEKVRAFHRRHPSIPIQIDGGVSLQNAKKLLAAGASSLVIGSGILKAKDPAAAVAAFEELESPFGV